MRRLALASCAAGLICAASTAQAQFGTHGFRLDQYTAPPAAATEDGLALPIPATLGHLRYSLGIIFDYAHSPLVLEDLNSGDTTAIVEHRFVAHLLFALGLSDYVDVHVRLPILLGQGGDDFAMANIDSVGITDAAIGGSVSFFGSDLLGAQLGLNLELVLPIGSDSLNGTLGGDGHPEVRAMLTGGYGHEMVTFAVSIGTATRPAIEFGTSQIGPELVFGAGVYVTAVDQLVIMGELWGANTPRADEDKTAIQALVGARYTLDMGLAFSGGIGLGFTQTAGVPDVRALLGVGYAPPRAGDCDADGLDDDEDECECEPEDIDQWEDENGCPDPDNDQDGLLDPQDECPNDPEDRDNFEDENGCPDPDNDQDGILDTPDQCPLEPEDRDNFEDENGCPDPDNDQDTILDADDDCPNEPGPVENRGCPVRATLEATQIRILQRIEFDNDQATLRPESIPVLEQVARIVRENPQIAHVRIEGHTDSTNTDEYNQDLSERRANTVLRWLTREGGIQEGRLEAVGFGESRPIASNDTDQGRQTNRRVEFHWSDE